MTPQFLAEVTRRIRLNEGCELEMYYDSVGVPTIGVGFNLERDDAPHILAAVGADYDDVMAGGSITEAQADKILSICLAPVTVQANAFVKTFWKLSDPRRFVIMDMIFNLGAEGFAQFHQTIAAIEAGDFIDAATRMKQSLWFEQVGDRAVRDVRMMRTGQWVPQ